MALGLASLMGFARVYAGAHFPQHVVDGLLFGAAVSLLVWVILHIPMSLLVE